VCQEVARLVEDAALREDGDSGAYDSGELELEGSTRSSSGGSEVQ
jgi:hypothetical protein